MDDQAFTGNIGRNDGMTASSLFYCTFYLLYPKGKHAVSVSSILLDFEGLTKSTTDIYI